MFGISDDWAERLGWIGALLICLLTVVLRHIRLWIVSLRKPSEETIKPPK